MTAHHEEDEAELAVLMELAVTGRRLAATLAEPLVFVPS